MQPVLYTAYATRGLCHPRPVPWVLGFGETDHNLSLGLSQFKHA